jgi:hypothetical protein
VPLKNRKGIGPVCPFIVSLIVSCSVGKWETVLSQLPVINESSGDERCVTTKFAEISDPVSPSNGYMYLNGPSELYMDRKHLSGETSGSLTGDGQCDHRSYSRSSSGTGLFGTSGSVSIKSDEHHLEFARPTERIEEQTRVFHLGHAVRDITKRDNMQQTSIRNRLPRLLDQTTRRANERTRERKSNFYPETGYISHSPPIYLNILIYRPCLRLFLIALFDCSGLGGNASGPDQSEPGIALVSYHERRTGQL